MKTISFLTLLLMAFSSACKGGPGVGDQRCQPLSRALRVDGGTGGDFEAPPEHFRDGCILGSDSFLVLDDIGRVFHLTRADMSNFGDAEKVFDPEDEPLGFEAPEFLPESMSCTPEGLVFLLGPGVVTMTFNFEGFSTSIIVENFTNINASSSTQAVVTGRSGQLLFYDGAVWRGLDTDTTENLFAAHILDEETTYVAGDDNTLLEVFNLSLIHI